MKGLVAVSVAFLLILLAVYTKKEQYEMTSTVSTFDAVDPTIIQNTITQLQEKVNTLYPITTVYFDKTSDGYTGRIIFLDSKQNAGIQYDVNVDTDGKLTSASRGVPANFMNPWSGNVKKSSIGNLNIADPKPNMPAVWNNLMITA
jgi:hypothetical protein